MRTKGIQKEAGSIEMIAIGLVIALIIAIALPYLDDIGVQVCRALDDLKVAWAEAETGLPGALFPCAL